MRGSSILHFIDTSAYLKLFVTEDGSENIKRFAQAEEDRNKVVSVLAQVEARSAISRLLKGTRMTGEEASFALTAVMTDIRKMTEQQINPQVLNAANLLIDRYQLRTLDAVQLGCAIVARDSLAAPDMRFIASDMIFLLQRARRALTPGTLAIKSGEVW